MQDLQNHSCNNLTEKRLNKRSIMKNKILAVILVLGLLSIYPLWRYFTNAKVFAEALLNHASGLGEWTHGEISTTFDGKITIRDLSFKPHSYKQNFKISNITILTDPMFLLKNSTQRLAIMLPESLSLSINSASFNNQSDTLYHTLRDKSMWMLMAGFAGSFGCTRESYTSFDQQTWKNILSKEQVFNVDLYYSRQNNGSLDVD